MSQQAYFLTPAHWFTILLDLCPRLVRAGIHGVVMPLYEVSLRRIPETGDLKEGPLSLALEDLGLGAPFMGPDVTVTFAFRRLFDKVFGPVKAEAKARLSCGRCLKDFEATIRADFTVQFVPATATTDVDMDDDDPAFAVAFYEGESLPLGEELRQELELQLPYAPICQDGCRGLCQRCGHDLNTGDCACSPKASGGAFAALDTLLKRPKP